MIVMDEIVNVKQTQVHPGNQGQGWLRRLNVLLRSACEVRTRPQS